MLPEDYSGARWCGIRLGRHPAAVRRRVVLLSTAGELDVAVNRDDASDSTQSESVVRIRRLPLLGYGKLSGRLIDGQSGTVMQPSTQPPLPSVIFADERRAISLPAVCTSTP